MAEMRVCENCGHFVTVRNCPYCPIPKKEGLEERTPIKRMPSRVSRHLPEFTKRYAGAKRKKAVKK